MSKQSSEFFFHWFRRRCIAELSTLNSPFDDAIVVFRLASLAPSETIDDMTATCDKELTTLKNRAARHAAVVAPAIAAMTVAVGGQRPSTTPYFPARGEWQKKDPAAVGLDKARLDEAIAVAIAHENPDTHNREAAR